MVKFKAKLLFFDDKKILRYMDRTKARALRKFGSYVRQTAKRSIRKRKSASKPGMPPSSHTGLLKKFIFYAYDRNTGNVVIGPIKRRSNGDDVLTALEYGGESTLYEYRWKGSDTWHEEDRRYSRRKKVKEYRSRKINIAARPFMQPAFEKEQKQLPEIWRNSVR